MANFSSFLFSRVKKGTVIISNGSGKIRGYSCKEYAKKEIKSK